MKKGEPVKGDREWVCGPTGNRLVAVKVGVCAEPWARQLN